VLFTAAAAFFPDGRAAAYLGMAASLAVAAVAAGGAASFLGMAAEVVEELDLFSKTLLPVMSAAGAAAGNISSSAAGYAATVLFMNVLTSLARGLLIPLIYAYLAAAAAGAALGENGLYAAANFIKWLVMVLLTVITVAFTIYLTVSGVIANTADVATAKIAKAAVSTFLPVVGGMISDAAGTVASGAMVLKNTIGIFGMAAVAAVCALPFLKLGVQYLVFKLTAALIEPLADGRLGKLVSSVATAFSLMLGIAGAVAIMLFISILSVMKAVSVL
jgi:stage III sporulation protein AE